jgi:hypothetical protein
MCQISTYLNSIAQVRIVLRGHQEKITGLAFSEEVLVSSSADAQVYI